MIAGAALVATAVPSVAAVKSQIVVDAYSGRVIRAFNADASHPPASLAKMMTLYLTFEALERGKLRWYQSIRISRHAATRMPSKVYLRPGQLVRVRDLVYATAVKSANDAAVALAEAIAGSEVRFAQLMTRRAHQIGMKNTYFGTASGLPAYGQRTTARDMAKLGRALILHHRKYYHIFSTRYYRFGRRTFANTNRLLHRRAGVDGIKTGYTHRARFNLVTSARQGRKRVVTVVLGASSSRTRYYHTQWLIAAGLNGRPRTNQVAAIQRPGVNAERRVVAARRTAPKAVAKKAEPKAAPKTATQTAARTATQNAQVAAAPRFRPAGQFDSTGSDTAQPKSVIVAEAPKRKIDLSVIGTRASAAERKTGTAPHNVTAKTEREVVIRIGAPDKPKANAPEIKTAARSAPKAAPDTPAPDKTVATRATYAVQVGAHPQLALARRSAQKAFDTLPSKLQRGVKIAVMKPKDYKGRFYRARIVGLSKDGAAEACRYLKKKSLRCLAIRTRMPVEVAFATPAARQTAQDTRPAPTTRTTRTERAARKAVTTTGGYLVQVGAVTRYAYARRLARKARQSLPRTLSRHATAHILRPSSYKGRLYRVRLAGLSQAEAQEACRILKRRSVNCLAMRDRGTARRAQTASAPRGGRYAVQVGAVTGPSKARRLIRKARRTLPPRLARHAKARVLAPGSYDGRLYRARLTGLSRLEATRACEILRRKSLNCLPYRVDDA